MTAFIKKKKIAALLISFALFTALLLNTVGCAMSVQATDLMKDVTANKITGKATDGVFASSAADFAVKLFQKTVDKEKSSLISPLSVMLALAMTANGAEHMTKTQMETLLGGEIPLQLLNEYLYTYVQNLPSETKSKLDIANSIWFRDDAERLHVEQSFLQKNADYYHADAYKAPFDGQTLKDINHWVKKNTNGMIDKILDKIDEDTVMYLINAVIFDAEWETVYDKNNIGNGTFTAIDGTKQEVSMMFSSENQYISDANATGFIKAYQGGHYSFAALLPNGGVSLTDYIASMTGENFISAVKNAKSASVAVQMPKFSYDYTIQMNDALKALGMPDAFDSSSADFSKLGRSVNGNIYIGEVLHKTFISVDELGTKAGAVTKVEMKDECALVENYSVKLNRPFVYAIIDNETALPIFIGTVTEIEQ